MEKHPIENILSATMENLKSMIDVNTVIGQAVISPSGATIIPVSCVGFGFVSGGGEYGAGENNCKNTELKDDFPFAGGSGAGVSVKPSGFLVLQNNIVKFLPIQQSSTYDRIIDLMPQLINEVKDILKNGDKESEEETHSFADE